MKKLCIYHGNCADGFGAAWVVRKAFGDDVEFHAGVYQDSPPEVADRNVIMVDFSYKRDVLEEIAKTAHTITIIDHHKSAEEDLSIYKRPTHEMRMDEVQFRNYCGFESSYPIRAIFDLERSGARLAWDFYFPNEEPPQLINHIQDRDLWQFKLSGTREIQAAIFSYPYDFKMWDELMKNDVDDLIYDGEVIERKHFKDIREFIKVAAYRMDIAGYDVPVLNAPYFWSSDAGHIMGEGEPFAACYWDTPDGRVFSLRSAEDGLDVSEIAKQFGGGGHKHAAGYRINA